MEDSDHLKRNTQDLVYGYVKQCKEDLSIPTCIMHLVMLFVSIAEQFTLFNYGHFGEDLDEHCEFTQMGFERVTSILAGITFDFIIFHKIRINIGSRLQIDLYPKAGEYQIHCENYNHDKQIIKTVLGNIWKYPQKDITMLALMSKETYCTCYNREGNQFTIYLLNDHDSTKPIFNYYSEIWTNYPLPLKLNTDDTACIVIDLGENFIFEESEDVTIEYLRGDKEQIRKCRNGNSLIPINDCAQGWVCCYNAFFS